MENLETLEFTAEESSKRVDNFLAEKLDRSRSYISYLIQEGFILLNGKPPKKSEVVNVGDSIKITFPKEENPDLTPRKIDFKVVFDTGRYAIIDKPAGITVHPAPGHLGDTLVNGLLYAFDIEDDEETIRPGIVHRLDKDTSGLLIIAKDSEARETLSKLFHDRKIDKYYKAVASGTPHFSEIIVEEAIARDEIHRQRMAISKTGREAKTKVKVAELYKNAFLADITLYTGRTHQIRVHMKHLGHPLLGDKLYGGKQAVKYFHRQALHAYKLEFTDPFNHNQISVFSDMPEDMQNLISRLKLS